MRESLEIMAELLATVMPDSDAGKLGTFLILAFLVLTATGRFKLEWFGIGSRHVFRWLRCKIRNKHYWKQSGIGWMDFETGRQTGTFVCDVFGKVVVRR
ncbi:MAG: hypothetical protein OXI35_16585 [Gemmatimonadota bacterium]|nr:hypothetical protein [Gemmatimonadota bacterium]